MFDRKGEIKVQSVKGKVQSEEETLELIDLGAEDIESFEEDPPAGGRKYLVYVEGSELNTMGNKITQAGYEVELQELTKKPNILIPVKDGETAKKVLDFAGKLEELDDVQKVYANFDIPEDLI